MEQEQGKTFENFEVEPSPTVWQHIEARLPVKRKRRWLLGWILPGLFIGGLVTGYLLWNNVARSSYDHSEFPSQAFIAEDKTVNEGPEEIVQANAQVQTNESIVRTSSMPPSITNIPSVQTSHRNKSGKTISIDNNNKESQDKKNATNTRTENSFLAFAGNEAFILAKPSKKSFDIVESHRAIADRENADYARPSYTRWSIYAGYGFTISASASESNISSDILSQEKTVASDMLEGGLTYEASPRIRISLGARKLTVGNEGMAKVAVISRGTPTDPNTIYTVQTTSGDLSGPSTVFNQAFFGTVDTTLFVGVSITGTPPESSTEITVKMRREFSYVEFPLAVMLKLREGKLTPTVGALFSVGRLTDHKEYINGQRLKYEYEDGLSKMNYSVGVTAGLDLNLGRLGFYLGGFYQKGLKSITSGEKPFKPYVAGTTAGCRFRF